MLFDHNRDLGDLRYEGRIRGHYVYHMSSGLSLPTRYVFKGPWTDKKLGMSMKDGELTYWDSKGRPVLVWENDEDEYYQWEVPSTHQ